MPKFIFLCLLLLQTCFVFAQDAAGLKLSAEQGNALAQAKLASLYILGRDGFEKDEKQAAVWMEKAASQGLASAQIVMAAMYDKGMGVVGDRDKATQLYEKAAAQGNETALALLGKNPVAQGGVKFSYQALRFNASKTIPTEYAKKILTTK